MKHLLLALCLTACTVEPKFVIHPPTSYSPKRVIPVAIDTTFTEQEKEQLLLSLTDWNLALNNEMVLKVYTDHFDMAQSDIDYIYSTNGFMMLKIDALGPVARNLAPNIVAMTENIGGHIIYFIAEKIRIPQVRYRAGHEIAHILGAEHTNYGFMKREYDPLSYACIDFNTISQVARFNGLDVQRLNWCVQ